MQVYEDVLVPAVFAPLAELMLDELGVQSGERVLDVACGPGTVALAATRRGASAIGCDISPAMLDLARAKSSSIEWVETGAAPLVGIADETFDVVVCQQGLQFFPDRPAAVAEMRRALVPGGRVGIAVWTYIEQSPPFAALAHVLAKVLDDEVADRFRSGPWGMPDPDVLRSLLVDAGFDEVRVVERQVQSTFDSVGQLVSVLAVSPVGDEFSALGEAGQAALAAAVDPANLDSSLVSNIAVARR